MTTTRSPHIPLDATTLPEAEWHPLCKHPEQFSAAYAHKGRLLLILPDGGGVLDRPREIVLPGVVGRLLEGGRR